MTSAGTQLRLRSKSRAVYDEIAARIREGRLHPGDRLPSERELARQLGTTQVTVRRGLATLAQRGMLRKRPGVGNFVADSVDVEPVAFVVPGYMLDASHPFSSRISAGIRETLDPSAHPIWPLGYDGGGLCAGAGERIECLHVRNMILTPTVELTADELRPLIDRGMRVVLLRDAPALLELNLPTVEQDFRSVIVQLIAGLVERGHRKMRVLVFTHNTARAERIRVVRETAQRLGLTDDLIVDIPNAFDKGMDLSVIDRLLDSEERPTAIIAPDEMVAAAVFRACYSRRIRIPDEMSLVSMMDAFPQGAPIALAAPDFYEIGRQVGQSAARMLQRLIRGEPVLERHVRIGCPVQWHASAGAVPVKK